jgi:hypothetical protein
MALLKAKVLKEGLSVKQTDRVRALAHRLLGELGSHGTADADALMTVEGVVYDIERIIYRQPKRR